MTTSEKQPIPAKPPQRPVSTKVITLKAKDYDWPVWLEPSQQPAKKPTVVITEHEIQIAAESGVTWTQLERYYTVDQETLKRHFLILYEKHRATLEINILNAMVTSAVSGNPAMMKWLSANYLNMSERTTETTITEEQPTDENQVNLKIKQLMDKLIKDKK